MCREAAALLIVVVQIQTDLWAGGIEMIPQLDVVEF